MIRDDEPTVSDAIVVTDVVDPGEGIVVSVKEFSDWLYSRKEVPNDTNGHESKVWACNFGEVVK